jgi:hypothetical protein
MFFLGRLRERSRRTVVLPSAFWMVLVISSFRLVRLGRG